MKHFSLLLASIAVATLASLAAELPQETVVPLTRAHAHNDYEHKRPLFDALDHGFCSVEADIYLVDGQLLVAHERNQVKRGRTLQSLYLDPLRQRVRENGGRVYRNGPMCFLLIDIKTEAETTYAALHNVLKEYADMLTRFEKDQTQTNAITAVITGNRAEKVMLAQPVRYAAYDGRLSDLDTKESSQFIQWISNAWPPVFRWHGSGPFPPEEKAKLTVLLDKAHREGRLVRFWATPDTVPMWQVLYGAGVDLINTDDLDGLQRFLLQQMKLTDGER
jgi:hypothetical protein